MSDDKKGSAWIFWALLVVLGAFGTVLYWNQPARQGAKPPVKPVVPVEPPKTFEGDPKEATDKLLKALNRELEAMDLLKLLEEEVSTKRVSVAGKEILSYTETFRLPRRYSLDQVLGPLHRAARELGAGLSAKPAVSAGEDGNVLNSCEFAYSQEWVPVRLTFVEVRSPRICLILDDAGYQRGEVLRLLYSLKVPVTAAIIPGARYSTALAKEFPSHGVEVMCHMPMEGHEMGAVGEDYPQLLKKGMGSRQVRKLVEAALAGLPNCRGLNNHMGSVASEDPDVVWDICRVLGGQGLYLVDSKTSPRSAMEFVAKKEGVAAAHRDVFLDNVEEGTAVEKQVEELAQRAGRKGQAVGIGHFKVVTLATLAKLVPALKEQGFRFVYASEIVE